MDIEMVLERVGPKKEEVIINKNFFYCGRMKESDLVCLSLLVSREHCVFTKLPDGLYVTDLGSSNGVFVNGIAVRQKKQILLKDNDLIGIGCAELSSLDESMFVYKVKNRVVISNNCDSSTSGNSEQESVRHARKEQSRSRKSENISIPAKIAKTATEHRKANINHVNTENDDDDDIIEIVQCTSTSNLTEQKLEKPNLRKELLEVPSASDSSKQKHVNLHLRKEVTECSVTSVSRKQRTEKPNVTKEASVILPDIIDITDVEVSSVNEKNNDVVKNNLVPPANHLKIEPMQIDTGNRLPIESSTVSTNVNVKQEPENDDEYHDDLVNVKQEPDWGCFSQIDLVEINDDDDSIFPSSQLFDKTGIKQECENDNDNIIPHSSFFDDDDDDENVITIRDSDDDDEENVHKTNLAIDLLPKIKVEPSLEFVDVTKPTSPVSNEADDMCLNDINIPSNEECTTFTNDKTPQSEEQLLPSHEKLVEPLRSKDAPSTSKTKRKGPEIIEPHYIKPKKKSEKTDIKGKSKSKNKEESRKKDSDRKKKHSSESSKSSSRDKVTSEESSKNKKHKNVKEDHSSSNSKKSDHSKDSNKSKKSTGKHKSSSENSKEQKDSKDKNEKKKNHEDHSKNDSNLVQNPSPTASGVINQTRPRHKTTIVKVKVSSKTRGDMLCDSMQILRPKPKKDAKKSSSETAKAEAQKTAAKPNFSSFVIPRRQVPSSILPNYISTVSQLNTPPPSISSAVVANGTNRMNLSPSSSDNNERPITPPPPPSPPSSPSPPPPPPVESTNNQDASAVVMPLKPSLTIPSLLNTTQKRVSFKENIAAVREFPIEAGNQMRNIKDGLGIRSSRKDFAVYKGMELKIQDFLSRVFAWEPVWLEQQQTVKVLPPIVKQDDMQQLPNTFDSFEQYYRRMEVLLLLETWQQLLKEYECTGNRYNSSVVLPCTILQHSVRQMHTANGLRYSEMVINTLVTRNQLRLQNHPVYGDMIILEYVIKQGASQKMRRAFAYVLQVHQQNSMKFVRSNPQLCKYVTDPAALLTYTVQTRIIDEHTVQFDQVARLRSILYMRSHLRLIQGLQFVPHSALRDSILKVNIEDFQLETVTKQEIYKYHLVTNEKLNEKQMEAVIKFTNASVRLEPKIGLLVGPPGTGKSKVIANLVTQILYGDGRYVGGRPLRILVCAPSNAAIDEIVLRLLDIRGAIKDHRFKMVRIGRMESMHEEVKKISVSELAKREAQKTYYDQQHKYLEDIERKKHKLKNDIDALETLLAGNPQSKMYGQRLEIHRAEYRKLAHKSPEEEAAELSRLQNSAKTVLLQKANVIACTLSSCYTSQMESIFGGNSEKIATCIVDEATQCCEAETLIPLMLGVKSLILVGDPNQLPATVMSTDAKKLGLDRSLFTRAKESLEPQYNNDSENNGDPVIMLNEQYRMVNAISHWPNRYFYGGKLIDCVNYKQAFPFQPYRILNLDGLQDDIKFSNTSEAVFVGNLIHCLMTCAKLNSWETKISVGVITPYQSQKALILSTIKEQTKNVPEKIRNKFITEVNTIDSFQGQERDVIIMSCVRSSGIGFLSDQQRLCVALTRAKFTLIICGNFTTFQKDNMWKDLLRDARSRGVVARLNTTAKPGEIKPHVVRLE